jgi:hypothetical protein
MDSLVQLRDLTDFLCAFAPLREVWLFLRFCLLFLAA